MSDGTFYATAAQVIPVFWIVSVFQLRLLGDEPGNRISSSGVERHFPIWMLIALAIQGPVLLVAELISVISLASHGNGSFARGVVIGALIGGSLLVFLIPITPWVEEIARRLSRNQR